jgi:hypothetical protein
MVASAACFLFVIFVFYFVGIRKCKNKLACFSAFGPTFLPRWPDLLTNLFKTAVVSRAMDPSLHRTHPSLENSNNY